MTRSQKGIINVLRNSDAEFVYSCTFLKRINMKATFSVMPYYLTLWLPLQERFCSTYSRVLSGPVTPKDVRTDTPEPVCRYRFLTYNTPYQFLESERTSFSLHTSKVSTSCSPASKVSTNWKLNHDSTTSLIPQLLRPKTPDVKSKQ